MTRISDSGLSVAVVGATGQVGTVMREILAERAFPIRELRLFATARSAGTSVEFAGRDRHHRGRRDRGPERASTSRCSRPERPAAAPTHRASPRPGRP